MNKKLYLILLAVAAQQSSVLAKTTTGEIGFDWYERREARKNANQDAQANQTNKETPQTKAPTPTTPAILISGSLSDNPEYRANIETQLRQILDQVKRGSVDVTNLEAIVITEHAPTIIQPGTDAFNELDQKHAQLTADHTSLKYKTALAAIASFCMGYAVSSLLK